MAIPSSVYSGTFAGLSPAEKIAEFNRAGTTVDELTAFGVDSATINWMLSNGYSPVSESSFREPTRIKDAEPVDEPPVYEPIYYYATDGTAFTSSIERDGYNSALRYRQEQQAEAERRQAEYLAALREAEAAAAAQLVERQEAERRAAEQEAIRQENIRQQEIRRQQEEQARIDEYYRQEAIREAERAEAARIEAARLEAERAEAARAEAARLEAARVEAARVEAERVEAARQEAIRQEQIRAQQLAAQQEAARQEAARIAAEQQTARDKAASVGVNLPSNWFDFSGEDKAKWLTSAKVTEGQISQIVGASGLDALKQYGYYDVLAREAAAAEAARAEAARQEAARVEAARIKQEDLNNAVKAAMQNGFTVDELKTIAKDMGVPESMVDQTLTTMVGSKANADIIKEVTALAEGKPIGFDKIVEYADNAKLPYATVADALKSTFKDTTAQQIVDSMVYEKDRQQFSAIGKDVTQDGKTVRVVDLGDAISTAIKQSISPANLAKFYGKTEAEFKALVNTNLKQVADAVRRAGIDAQQGLTDLLGVDKSATQTALRDVDVTTKLQDLQKDKLTYSEILGVAKEHNIPISDFVNKYLGGDNKEALINALTAETKFTPQEQALREAYRGMEVAPTMQQILDYQKNAKLSDAEMERIFGDLTKVSANDLDKTKTSLRLEELKSDGTLTLNEILGVVQDKNMSVNDFVNRYLGGDDKQKSEAIASLNKELEFSPQERSWREAYSNIKEPINISQAANFQTANKLSDADMQRIFNIPAASLDNYRVITALQGYSGEDNQLSYAELTQFAKDNNMDLSKVVNYIGTEETRPDILKNLQDYVKDEEFKSSLSDVKLTDYKGAQYSANQLLNLANQVKQNFDLKNSSGGVFKTSGESVGFDYDEAKKLFPEGKEPTTFDQVAIDIARGLLKAGIKDVSELSKYKPTEVTEYDYNVESGPPAEYKVTKLINPETGEEAPSIGATYTGQGGTVYGFTVDESGKPVFSTSYTETSDKQAIAMVVAMGAAFLAPQILPQLIGAAPAAVAGVEGAVAQAALGGTGLTGSLMAAGIPASVAGYAATAIVNGVYNGIVAEATGGDFEKAFINGGVAPVLGQLATNAVNSMATGLPSGVASAVGNAVTQLITTGEIDPGQLATAGIKPAAVQTIIDASGGALNAATARLVFDTVASGGKNITSLADNPAGVVNFVIKNQDVFNNIATAAATGTDQKPAAADISSLDTVQQEVLTSQPRTETIQGEALFQDINQTELGRETAEIGIVKPPGEVITTDTSGTPTGPDPYAGYDNAVKFAEALASGATQFDGVEAATKLRQALSSGALDFYNYDLARLETQLINNQPTQEKAKAAAEGLYGEGASYSFGGKFYEGTLGQTVLKDDKGNEYRISKEATLITNPQGGVTGYTLNGKTYDYRGNEISTKAPVAEVPGSTEVPDARLPNGMYSLQGFRAAGGGKDAEDYRSYVIAANELINKTGSANELNPSAYNIAAARASDMSTRAGIVSTSVAYTQPTQAPLSSYSAAGSPYLAGFGHMAMAVGSSGATLVEGMLRGLNQTEAADRVAEASRDAYKASQNIAATSPDVEKTLAVSSGVLSGMGILLGGGAVWSSAIAPTMVAMNATFRDGQDRGLSDMDNLTRTLGVGAAEYVGDVIGNKVLLGAVKSVTPGTAVAIRDSLVDGYSKLPANATTQQIKDMVGAWAKINGVEQFTEGVTTALQIANDKIHGITDTSPKDSKELADLVKSQMEIVFGATNIALGLGGGAYAASQAANIGAVSIEYADRVAREPFDKTIQDIVDVTPVVQTVGLLTGPNNQTVLNSQGQPILIQSLSNQPNLTIVSSQEGVVPNEFSVSTPTETVFDLVFDNEGKGYTVNSVNLDGNIFNVTMADGKAGVINAIDLQNNALNLITQSDPAAAKAIQESGDLTAILSKELAKTVNLNAVSQGLNAGSVVASNDKGAFVLTSNGTLAFAPNIDSSTGGVSLSKLNTGDSVVIGNGYVAPAKQEVDASGGVQVKVDELKINPLSGFGRVIGLDESQALVVLPNQELLTINRSSLTPTQNQDLTQGSLVPYNESTVTQRGVTADTALSSFGLTQTQLLQGMGSPATQLPVLVNVNSPTGASVINTALPDVSVGKVVSVDPIAQTALVSTALGNPQLVNLQGILPPVGGDLFFNPALNVALGTPITTASVTQTQPSGLGSLISTTYTPIGTTPPSIVPPDVPPVVTQPPIVPIGVDTIPGIGIDTVEGGELPVITPPDISPPVITLPVETLPVVTPPVVTTPVVTTPVVKPPVVTPRVPFPSLFFPYGDKKVIDINYDDVVVPPPELPGAYEMPYPNYLRPLDPYLGYGIGALMGDLYDEKQGYGEHQPFQNAQGQIKIPT